MTATAQTARSADTDGSPDTVGGGITRLNPADGLFLRAEHLAAMQDYARELTLAVGLANGTGVVHGYDVVLSTDHTAVHVSGGLAIDPAGRPLRSRQLAVASLSELQPSVDAFWVVEVTAASWLFGDEGVFGNLCDDPCDGGGSIHPWSAEGVKIRLRKDTMPGLDSIDDVRRRNWLASQYYEREREQGKPWLIPDRPGGTVGPITDRPWSSATPAPSGDAVALGTLQRIGDDWLLDVWTARRDIGDPPPKLAWQWRLGMRAWQVFVAQVLQFQAQVADGSAPTVVAARASARDAAAAAELLSDTFERQRVKPHAMRQAIDKVLEFVPLASIAGKTLWDLGYGELPPAGLLGVPSGQQDLQARLTVAFGNNVDLRFCECRADYVPCALEAAQHLDRIPLDQADRHPQVDILIPAQPADLPATRTASYGWVAFARRRDRGCDRDARYDEVDVYVADTEQRIDAIIKQLGVGRMPFHDPITVRYPAGEWGVMTPPQAYLDVQAKIGSGPPELGVQAVVGVASSADRRPLMAARAGLFVVPLENEYADVSIARTYVVAPKSAMREAIIVLLTERAEPA
jgi:hypothetical protein